MNASEPLMKYCDSNLLSKLPFRAMGLKSIAVTWFTGYAATDI